MTNDSPTHREYPWTAQIGNQQITLRPLTSEDRDELLAFVQSLPEEDLLFLSLDITRPAAIDHWINDISAGRIETILAQVDGQIVGYASLHHNQLRWMRHLGEVRIQVSPGQRGRGLGKLLVSEVFSRAHTIGLRKVVARMPTEQRGAIQVFDKLGFTAEALLADYAIDRNDRTHDLIVMSHDVTGFTE